MSRCPGLPASRARTNPEVAIVEVPAAAHGPQSAAVLFRPHAMETSRCDPRAAEPAAAAPGGLTGEWVKSVRPGPVAHASVCFAVGIGCPERPPRPDQLLVAGSPGVFGSEG